MKTINVLIGSIVLGLMWGGVTSNPLVGFSVFATAFYLYSIQPGN